MAATIVINFKGIVIQKYDSGETDLVLHVMSPSHGKVSILVKHAKRTKKSFGSRLDLFDAGVFQVRQRAAGLSVLSSFELQQSCRTLRTDIDKLILASLLCETVDLLVKEESAHDSSVYEALLLGLKALDESAGPGDSLKAAYLSLSHILAQSGISDMEKHDKASVNSFVHLLDQLEAFLEKPVRSRSAVMEVLDRFREIRR